ncbi:MAG: shikimate dehydrogenase [Sediminicola sp.]
MEHKFGLVGRNISYSFSKKYFAEKFAAQGLGRHTYENFDLPNIEAFPALLKSNPDLQGLNITIPYKEAVLPYLDALDPMARAIGAVNTVHFTKDGLVGHNTDAFGFRESLLPQLRPHHKKSLILGTGGASKAIAHVLRELGITVTYVSRNPTKDQLAYSDIDAQVLGAHTLIINCSPVGTYPNITDRPQLPYASLSKDHLLYDLIYNPERTAFLKQGEAAGASVQNGLGMLVLQAEKAWEIWNTK